MNIFLIIIGIVLVWLAFELIGGLAAFILGIILLIIGVKYLVKGTNL